MRVRRLSASLAVALVATLGTPLAADAAAPSSAASGGSGTGSAPRGSGDPRGGHRSTGRLQVRFKDGVDAKGRDAALARVRAKGLPASVVRTGRGVNAALVKAADPAAVHALLREDPAVAYVEAESTYRTLAADPQTAERTAAGLPDAASRAAGTAATGAGTEIAVIDSVVDGLNPDLAGKVLVTADLTQAVGDNDPDDGWTVTDLTCDAEHCPHGTGVAAVAAGADGNGDVVGAAPGASVSSYNVFRRFLYEDEATGDVFEDLSASSLDIAEALDAVRLRAMAHPELVAVNMSLGGTFDNQLVKDEIAQLRADAPNVTVVVAAGNDGGERAQFPAGDPGVVSVGASGNVGDPDTCTFGGATTVSFFSSRGDVDLVAPGACVLTWYRGEGLYPGQHAGPRVKMRVDGTSFAAPMVAGVVALLGAAGVKGDAARAALLAGATPPAAQDVAAGVGFLNAANALAVGTGANAYTGAFLDRGGQVANQVGRRTVEVIQVQPGVDATAPEQAVPTLPAGRGALTGAASATSGGVRRTTYTYAPPATNVGGVSFAMTAGSVAVPMRLLDPTDGFEGLPVLSGDQSTVLLTYGSRSAYVRSANIVGGDLLRVDYQYGDGGVEYNDPDVGPSSDLYFWAPATQNGAADAAMEPFAWAAGASYTGWKQITAPRPGKYLFGWVLFSEEDDSNPADTTSRYKMKPKFGPDSYLTVPARASDPSGSGPFPVTWTSQHAIRYEIDWTTKVKSSSGAWNYGTWTRLAAAGATGGTRTFGLNNVPVRPVRGQTYWFRVRTYDGFDNPSPYVIKSTVVPQDNLHYSMSYAGSWAKRALGGRWDGWVHQSNARGASVTHRTDLTQFWIIGDKCATCGQFQVWVDGVHRATVDSRSSSAAYRQALWSSPNYGAPKAHTIKIVVLGTAGRPWVVLDGIGTLR
ncbi:MAG TPA: S8 family serine peptidase [Frankiaceae bacterium]|jgi:hypothetical protein|nr:S8 family serine peptidase [Frankiaceae bacterium]